MIVYLAGAINGCTDMEANWWRGRAKALLAEAGVNALDPMRRDYRGMEDTNVREIVELDKQDIDKCSALLVYYDKPSVGTAMEIFYAFERGKKVLVFTEAKTISPWLRFHATGIFETMEEAIGAL